MSAAIAGLLAIGDDAHNALRAVGVKAESPLGPRTARCLDADEHRAKIGAAGGLSSELFSDAPTYHFPGALAQLKPSLRSVGASRA